MTLSIKWMPKIFLNGAIRHKRVFVNTAVNLVDGCPFKVGSHFFLFKGITFFNRRLYNSPRFGTVLIGTRMTNSFLGDILKQVPYDERTAFEFQYRPCTNGTHYRGLSV